MLFLGACFTPGNYFMVTELMPRGSLHDLLKENKEIPFKKKMKMAKDAALGMNWLHCSKPPFIHRDLKTQNILVCISFPYSLSLSLSLFVAFTHSLSFCRWCRSMRTLQSR